MSALQGTTGCFLTVLNLLHDQNLRNSTMQNIDQQNDDLPQRVEQGLTDPQMSMEDLRAAAAEAKFRTDRGERTAAGVPPVPTVHLFNEETARGDQWVSRSVLVYDEA